MPFMNLREMFRERADQPDSAYAWLRLGFALIIGAIGGLLPAISAMLVKPLYSLR